MISKFSQCIISGRDSMLIALLITAVSGCIVRGHHTFMVGFDLDTRSYLTFSTSIIAIIISKSRYINNFSYYNLLKRGVRISLRSKVNDSLITGLRIVDSILPVGRGQRQLILGDRYTGKTSIYLSLLLHCNYLSLLGSIEGMGTKRIFGLYVGINQNLSKLSKFISFI